MLFKGVDEMPPKAQITREMIIKAGFELIKNEGESEFNVRRIAERLGCSTQPVMYRFSTVDELREELYSIADSYHSEYITALDETDENPLLAIGLKYIRFAAEEKHLFRFLFQSDKYAGMNIGELVCSEGLEPILEILQAEAELTPQQSRDAFVSLFISAHGMASLIANNSMEYDEEYFENVLNNVFMGVIGMMKGGNV